MTVSHTTAAFCIEQYTNPSLFLQLSSNLMKHNGFTWDTISLFALYTCTQNSHMTSNRYMYLYDVVL